MSWFLVLLYYLPTPNPVASPSNNAIPQMVTIDSGDFLMGDQHDIGYADEQPVYKVSIAYSYAISRYEITFDEYDRFARATGLELPPDQGWGRSNRPVINVSWYDAVAYTRWLSIQTGDEYRLPSEAEWEYAAKARSSMPYWWGQDVTGHEGNFRTSRCDSITSARPCPTQTSPVGAYLPNSFGLYDTAGNVEEWVVDCYHDNYIGAPKDGTAREHCDYQLGVVRGGSWRSEGHRTRVSARNDFSFDEKSSSIGFRIVKELESDDS